jgi:predicted secreted protein
MAGIDAFGTQLLIHDGASSYDAVAEVVSVDVMDVSVDDLDVTSHDSPSQWKEFLGGLKDGGELSMELNFDPELHATLLSIVGVSRDMRLMFPDGDNQVNFEGYINGMSAAAPHDDKLSASLSVKVSGPIAIVIT